MTLAVAVTIAIPVSITVTIAIPISAAVAVTIAIPISIARMAVGGTFLSRIMIRPNHLTGSERRWMNTCLLDDLTPAFASLPLREVS